MMTFLSNKLWFLKLKRQHPEVSLQEAQVSTLRFVWGIGRSGSSWMAKVLAQTTTPCRLFLEPLSRMSPAVKFSPTHDRTALSYQKELPCHHPLLVNFSLLSLRSFQWSKNKAQKTIIRDDPDWKFCLVKEVHALLACEAVLRAWNCPAIFIVRNPVYILDSLFAAQGLETEYLNNEIKAVQEPEFLQRFAQNKTEAYRAAFSWAQQQPVRLRLIFEKLLTCLLLQAMFQVLAREYSCVRVFHYEEVCADPLKVFPRVADQLQIPWEPGNEGFLNQTMQVNADKANPYSVVRDTGKQLNRSLAFLQEAEMEQCFQALRQFQLEELEKPAWGSGALSVAS